MGKSTVVSVKSSKSTKRKVYDDRSSKTGDGEMKDRKRKKEKHARS